MVNKKGVVMLFRYIIHANAPQTCQARCKSGPVQIMLEPACASAGSSCNESAGICLAVLSVAILVSMLILIPVLFSLSIAGPLSARGLIVILSLLHLVPETTITL